MICCSGLPYSMTADYKKVYWLDDEQATVFAAPIDDMNTGIEKVSVNMGAHLNKILAYGMHLQFYPGWWGT